MGVETTLWVCKHCDKKRKTKVYHLASTSSAIRHLNRHHHIMETPCMEETPEVSRRVTIVVQLQRVPITHAAATLFKSDLIRLVVDSDLSFSVVQKPAFRRLLTTANSAFASTLLPQDTKTVKR